MVSGFFVPSRSICYMNRSCLCMMYKHCSLI